MKTCQISYISTTEGNPKWQNGWLRDIVVVYNLFLKKKTQGKIPKPVVWIQARAIVKTSLSPYKFTTAYHVWRPLIVSTIPCSNTRHKALPSQLGLVAFLNWKFRNVLLIWKCEDTEVGAFSKWSKERYSNFFREYILYRWTILECMVSLNQQLISKQIAR